MFWIKSLGDTFKALWLEFFELCSWVKKCHFGSFSERARMLVRPSKIKNFMDPLEVVKKHRVPNICIFFHCCVSECLVNRQPTVLELGLLAAVFELNRTIWQDLIAFLRFFLPGATFLVTSSILLSWNKENLLLNHTYPYRICGVDPYSMLLNYLLTKVEGRAQWPKIADSWTSLLNNAS